MSKKPRTLHADVPTFSQLIAQNVLLSKNESASHSPYLSKNEKRDFGVRKENVKDFNLLIIKWIQTNDMTPENTRKKDLSVSGVSLKSFLKNT